MRSRYEITTPASMIDAAYRKGRRIILDFEFLEMLVPAISMNAKGQAVSRELRLAKPSNPIRELGFVANSMMSARLDEEPLHPDDTATKPPMVTRYFGTVDVDGVEHEGALVYGLPGFEPKHGELTIVEL